MMSSTFRWQMHVFLYAASFAMIVVSAVYAATPLPPELQKEVCEYVAAGRSRVDYSINRGWIDVNNDGVDERVGFTIEGSSASVCQIVWLPSGEVAPEISTSGQDEAEFRLRGWGAKDQRWMRFKGHTFLVSYHDNAMSEEFISRSFPQTVWYVTPDFVAAKLCDVKTFKEIENGAITPDVQVAIPNAEEICRLSAEGSINSYIQFESEKKELGVNSYINGYAWIDVDNDGTEGKVLQARYNSGAGAGCAYPYFMQENSKKIAEGQTLADFSKPLYKLQQEGDSFINLQHPICNDIYEAQLFSYGEQIFLERKTKKNETRSQQHNFHQVWFFKQGKAIPVCQFKLTIKTDYSLTPLAPSSTRTEFEPSMCAFSNTKIWD